MRQHYKIMLFSSLALCFIFICGIYFMKNLASSYALTDNITLPEGTFTSNIINSSSTTNYVKDALTAKGTSSAFADSFAIPSNMKVNVSVIPLYKLSKNYDTPTVTERFEKVLDNPVNVTDKGLLYILTHGYTPLNFGYDIFSTNTYGSIDDSAKQYVTQIAIWLYIYEKKSTFTTYCANNGCDFLNSSNTAVPVNSAKELISTAAEASNYKYLNYINLLVDNAKNYSGSQSSQIDFETTSLEYQINSNFTLLTTSTITPKVISNNTNFMYYSVRIDDPNNYGAYVVDNKGNKITNLNNLTESFKVAVPLKKDISTMDMRSIKIHVFGYFAKDLGLDYRVTSKTTGSLTKQDIFSNVLLGDVQSESVEATLDLYNFVKISKVDITDSSELSGATLTITNKEDESKKYTWISTATPYYLYLENGDYTLCETIAPKGYKLNTECIDFTVDGEKIVSLTMKNKPMIVGVPNTSKFVSKIIFYVGILSLLIGLMIISLVFMKKENDS